VTYSISISQCSVDFCIPRWRHYCVSFSFKLLWRITRTRNFSDVHITSYNIYIYTYNVMCIYIFITFISLYEDVLVNFVPITLHTTRKYPLCVITWPCRKSTRPAFDLWVKGYGAISLEADLLEQRVSSETANWYTVRHPHSYAVCWIHPVIIKLFTNWTAKYIYI